MGTDIAMTVAREAYPNGATLMCQSCRHSEHATTEDCARYLARGWPEHCGRQMRSERSSLSTEG